MKAVIECVICSSNKLKSRRASVAPFLAQRIWGRAPFRVDLAECADCGFMFFNPRLDEHEEHRLYLGYRDKDYQEMRHSFEPWYTERFNENLSSDATMRGRRECVQRILSPHLNTLEVRSILDFGGGRGELIVDLVPGADGYVFDLADSEPLPGIHKLRNLDDCKARRYDLIVCSNVLEHVAFPREVLREIVDAAAPGALLFVEVPFQSPFSYAERAKRLAQEAILMAMRSRIAWSLLKVGVLNMMHEHVNFFSPAALERVMSSGGLEVQASGVYGGDSLLDKGMLWSLSRSED